MGDPRRFNLLADFVAARISTESKLADVAAGKGYLSLALQQRGFKKITAFEPNPRQTGIKNLPLRAEYFSLEKAKPYGCLVAMHPDAATEEVICGAARYQCKMFIVPCCAISSRTEHWTSNQWKAWIDHLLRLCHKHALRVERTTLPMTGRNQLLWTPE